MKLIFLFLLLLPLENASSDAKRPAPTPIPENRLFLSDFESVNRFEIYIEDLIDDCFEMTRKEKGSNCYPLYEIWDSELNIYYNKLYKYLTVNDKKRLKDSQIVWIKERDLTMELIRSLIRTKYENKDGEIFKELKRREYDRQTSNLVKRRTLVIKKWYDDRDITENAEEVLNPLYCKNESDIIDDLICQNQELIVSHLKIAEKYMIVRSKLNSRDQSLLQDRQNFWRRERNGCRNANSLNADYRESVKACLKNTLSDRAEYLDQVSRNVSLFSEGSSRFRYIDPKYLKEYFPDYLGKHVSIFGTMILNDDGGKLAHIVGRDKNRTKIPVTFKSLPDTQKEFLKSKVPAAHWNGIVKENQGGFYLYVDGILGNELP